MKAYIRIVQISLVFVVVLIGSCTKDFEKINKDPNRATEVQTPYILTQVQRNIAETYFDSWQGFRMNGVIAQHWVQRTYVEEDLYDFSARTGTVSNFFNRTYTFSELANQIIKINENTNASAYGDPKLQVATVKILNAWLVFQNARTFGDVPYTEANDFLNFPTPKYDTQEFIFKDLIRVLKEVNADLQDAVNMKGWTSGDILLGGNAEKWRRFANSLRLQIAMNMIHVEPSLSATEADAAIADGVMRDNADNAVFRFISAGNPNQHPNFGDYASRMDFLPSWQFVNLLHGRDDDNKGFVNPFNGIVDPRFVQFVQSPADQAAGLTPRFDAIPMGLNRTNNDAVWGILSTDTRITYGPTANRLDDILPKPIHAAMWSTFMDYANVALFVAERQLNKGNAAECRDLYENAVQSSMVVWGIPEADATAYVTAVMAKFDAAMDNEAKFEMIITQKYIHNFAQLDQENLFEYRRTEYPKSVVKPGERTGGTYTIGGTPMTFTFTPMSYHGSNSFLQRMKYPSTEARFNKNNLDEAIKSIGGDTQSIPLYYSKQYKK